MNSEVQKLAMLNKTLLISRNVFVASLWFTGSPSFLWRFRGFSLFWYLPQVANIKYEKAT